MFYLMLILLKNNLNGNKNNFGTAVLIEYFLGVKLHKICDVTLGGGGVSEM